jgi:hypothetical protein
MSHELAHGKERQMGKRSMTHDTDGDDKLSFASIQRDVLTEFSRAL